MQVPHLIMFLIKQMQDKFRDSSSFLYNNMLLTDAQANYSAVSSP